MSAIDNGPLPEGIHRGTVDIPGGPLAVLDADPVGERQGTVLLVPGFTGSKEDFRLLLEPLARAGYRAVAVDQRGQFESDGPEELTAYTTEVLGADLVAVVKSLGDGPVHLVAHSFGGLVSRAAVLQEPTAFLSLVLMGSGPAALTGPRVDVLPFVKVILEESGIEAVYEAQESLPVNPEKPLVTPAVKAFLKTRMLANTPGMLLGMGEAITTEPDRVAELREVGLPLLVMYGERDDAWLPEIQDDMADRLGCGVIVITDAWHSPAVENAPVTAQVLLDFLAG